MRLLMNAYVLVFIYISFHCVATARDLVLLCLYRMQSVVYINKYLEAFHGWLIYDVVNRIVLRYTFDYTG